MDATHIQLVEVLISKIEEGIFHSKLICKFEDTDIEIDSRTSDALALAVRFDCPIYTYESILDNIDLSDKIPMRDKSTNEPIHSTPVEKEENDLIKMSIADLQRQLDEALELEDYIKAAKIRDEMNSRK